MSYQVLARKWRPQNFIELAGQDHVLQALMNALTQQRLHHAYLFTGTRGVGKTTIARIFAKCLNCETNGISPEPCGHCDSCQEITDGRFVDLIEVDAASRTKVEDTRELLENVQYAPTRGRFKVYLIDEVHMLSTHSFNALLKTLEEPPEHVKFLLATTDPQKLPVTILSRCLQFNLKNMSSARVVDYLKKVLTTENVAYEEAALWQIGQAADGSMRDALSLTDQAISFGNGKVRETDVTSMLGLVNHQQVVNLLELLAGNDAAAVLQKVNEFSDYQADYASICASLLDLLHRIAIEQQVPGALEDQLGDLEQVKKLAIQLNSETVQVFYQSLLIGKRDLSLSPSLKSGFEMLLLRLMAFRPSPAVTISNNPEDAIAVSSSDTNTQSPLVNQADTEKKTLNDEVSQPANITSKLTEDLSKSENPSFVESTTHENDVEKVESELDVVEPAKKVGNVYSLDETPSAKEYSVQKTPEETLSNATVNETVPTTQVTAETQIEDSKQAAKSVDDLVPDPLELVTKKQQANVNNEKAVVQDSDLSGSVFSSELVSESGQASKNSQLKADHQLEKQNALDDMDDDQDIDDTELSSGVEDLFELVTGSEQVADAERHSEFMVSPNEPDLSGVVAKNGVEGTYTVEQTILQPALGLSVEKLKDFSELTMQLWWLIAPRLPLKGLVHNILMNTCLLEASSQGVKLEVPLEYGHMLNQVRYEQIQSSLSDYFDQSVPLIIDTVENVSGVTAEEFAASKRAEAMQAAVHLLNDHPIVQALGTAMGGELIYESVKVKA
ncbi:DNA polymerase III subunit gamma/tau [Marinomonas agarivorans]|nr:DNA polymerase III subunit gamma/tau [Marinomonas agarivorans]